MRCQQRFEMLHQFGLACHILRRQIRAGAGKLNQNIGVMNLCKRLAGIWKQLLVLLHVKPGHIFKRLNRAARRVLKIVQKRQRGSKRCSSDHCRCVYFGFCLQFHHGRGDNPKRTFSTDHQMLQIIARIVFMQL